MNSLCRNGTMKRMKDFRECTSYLLNSRSSDMDNITKGAKSLRIFVVL